MNEKRPGMVLSIKLVMITFRHEEVPEQGDLRLRLRQRDQLGRAVLVDSSRKVGLLSHNLPLTANFEVGHQLKEKLSPQLTGLL